MAGSRRQTPLSPSVDTGHIPARTPGPLGVNDQGDPNVTTLLGDTPLSLGIRDLGDPTLPQFSSTDPSNQVCIDPTRNPLSIGFDAKPTAASAVAPQPSENIALNEAQDIALKISTCFEGGKPMNYQALEDDAFDGQGMSFGIIQWNFGQNTLGPLLKKMLDANATAFKACFGEGTDYDTLEKALKAGNKNNEMKWARDVQNKNHDAWESAFKNVGSNDTFNKIQRDQAVGQYHPLAGAVIKELRKISASLFANIELRSYAAIFDLCVQQHGISNCLSEIKKRIKDEKPASQLEAMKIVVGERARKANSQWRADCLSRRMGILTGAAYEATENEITAKRKNPQLSLVAGATGAKIVSGL